MKNLEQTQPIWPDTFRIPARPPLDSDVSADVCVVGAGIAGMSVAYKLASSGRSVVVLEAGGVGGGETERTTAHLSLVLESRYSELERVHGLDAVKLAAASHGAAVDEIERIVAREGIDCGFHRLDGYLFSAPGETKEALRQELAACLRAGIQGVESVERAPLAAFDTGPALRFPRQAQLNPLRYLGGLAEAFERLGGRIFCESRVESVEGGAPARARLHGGRLVTAGSVVVATNTPFNDRVTIHTKQASYRTYAIAAAVDPGSAHPALFWDTEDPSHYARIEPGDDSQTDMLIVGGEDHKTGQMDGGPEERFLRLENWALARFPWMGEVTHRWSGQTVNTADGLAFIGPNPGDERNVFIATGDCGNGMTYGTLAGMILPGLVNGSGHPWAELYSPGRVRAGSLKKWAGENLNAAAQYVTHLLPGDIRSVRELAPGTGGILRRGLVKIAVYRDLNGSLHELSANCPHLGSVVCWNAAENTWDCPAHGSRFSAEGKVLNGPAGSDLPDAAAKHGERR